jgi:hypothetical protein
MAGYYLLGLAGVLGQTLTSSLFWPVIPVAAAAAGQKDFTKVFLLAFILGILADFVVGRVLGESAIFLLVITLFISILKLRFQNKLWV